MQNVWDWSTLKPRFSSVNPELYWAFLEKELFTKKFSKNFRKSFSKIIDRIERFCFINDTHSTKIHWNTRSVTSDVFHIFTQSISSFNSIIVQMSEKRDLSNRQ